MLSLFCSHNFHAPASRARSLPRRLHQEARESRGDIFPDVTVYFRDVLSRQLKGYGRRLVLSIGSPNVRVGVRPSSFTLSLAERGQLSSMPWSKSVLV